MIELIHDKHATDILVFTDDADMAKKFRKAFGFDGAKYFGSGRGYSWVAPRVKALSTIRTLGIQRSEIIPVEK